MGSSLIGDTLIVGSSGWDQLHNGTVGRQIAYYVDRDGWHVSLNWMKLEGVQTPLPRHIVQTTVNQNSQYGYVLDPAPAEPLETGYRSGYSTLSMHPVTGEIFHAFHYAGGVQDEYNSFVARKSTFIPDYWNLFTNPLVSGYEFMWPKSVTGANGYVHVVSHHSNTSINGPSQLAYMRWRIDETNALVPATQTGNQRILSLALMNVSADVVTNLDGSRVAVGACVDRNRTLGETFRGGSSQWNSDVYVWYSQNSGSTFSQPINVTSFIGPYTNALPDTVFANGDTMRAYTDCNLLFDDEDRLHVAFSANNFDYLRNQVYYESRIYHWMRDDEGNDLYTVVHHKPFAGQPEAWGRTTDRPSMVFDYDTGILWCVMEEVDWGTQHGDVSRTSRIANSDILVSASPPGEYNGLLWTKPVNITNTKYMRSGGAPVGDSRSETDVSVSLNCRGDFLHLFYMLDLDAGCAVLQEGVMTDNPLVYHRVSKSELLQRFDDNAEWVVNYPMHQDHSGYWEDPGEWRWDDFGGFFTTARGTDVPVKLNIEVSAPMVPARGGILSAAISVRNEADHPYPDVDFWSMVTLPNGRQYGPVTWFTVNIPQKAAETVVPLNQIVPSYAPHGKYYYSMHLGDYPESLVSDSFVFTKLAGSADEMDGDEFIWDPDDWESFMTPIIFEEDEDDEAIPSQFTLSEAWPNPFNAVTSMTLTLPTRATAHVRVYDITGRYIATLLDGMQQAGKHQMAFDASDLASGVYVVRAEVDGRFTQFRKLVLIK